jgi:nitrogen fixation protein FixH
MDKLEFDNFESNASDYEGNQEVNNDVRINEEQQAIEFSSSVIAALAQKAKEHNDSCDSKVKLSQLKKVYRRGANTTEDKGLHAMARVNMFLRMKQDGKITYQEPKAEVQAEIQELVFENKARIKVNTFVDITEDWLPTKIDFVQASEDIKKYELNYNFKDINELYLDDYEKLDIIWG